MPFAIRARFDWRLRTRSLTLGPRTLIMGILNVTPDSFSDGGQFLSPSAAIDHAFAMLDDGADILDIGGESTRPEATPITPADEQARVLPVLRAILAERPNALSSPSTPSTPRPPAWPSRPAQRSSTMSAATSGIPPCPTPAPHSNAAPS